MAVEWLSKAGYNQVLLGRNGSWERLWGLKWLEEAGDMIHNYRNLKNVRRRRNIFVEVAGMPGAGKDRQLAMVEELGKDWIYCGKEPYSVLKDKGGPLRQDWLFWATIGELIAARTVFRQNGIEKGGLGILNRGIVDYEVMTRAKFKHGEISKEQMKLEYKYSSSPPIDATIVMVINRFEAVRRISLAGRVDSGKHSIPEFLEILRKEYDDEILNMLREGRQNLVVMNMEGSIENNLARFRKVLSRIAGKEV